MRIKKGFLRSERSLIQTIGRAARNANGHVIMYADKMTKSMEMRLMKRSGVVQFRKNITESTELHHKRFKRKFREIIRATHVAEEDRNAAEQAAAFEDEVKKKEREAVIEQNGKGNEGSSKAN